MSTFKICLVNYQYVFEFDMDSYIDIFMLKIDLNQINNKSLKIIFDYIIDILTTTTFLLFIFLVKRN